MYPIERYLRKLKCYVRNKAQPEGSIAEAVLYVLQNCDESLPFIQEHKNFIINSGFRNVEQIHKEEFIGWFREKIKQLYNEGQTNKDMLCLSRGPERRVTYHPCYNINGYKFHTTERDETKKTQNNGVMVHGENQNDVSYYGILKDIIELCYTEGNKVVLFSCEWFDTAREGIGFKRDRCGNIVLNTKKKLNTQEPFVLASQAIQVYYLEGINDPTWSTSIEIKPRNLYEMPMDEGEPYQEEQMQCTNTNANLDDNHEDEIDWSRNVEDNSHNIDVE
ncbi:hypothetical protein Q3G72_009470 [Acer saccharum]|nr:hypothetical protein Q3G72_009470 [Acer saccharum]